jgi:hypothetical protein
MNHHDAEITDVVVVLDGQGGKSIDAAVASLKQLGMEVGSINNGEGVIEGSIDTAKVHDLKAVPGVCYVRSVFSYVADYPAGDPRDKDGPEAGMETDED